MESTSVPLNYVNQTQVVLDSHPLVLPNEFSTNFYGKENRNIHNSRFRVEEVVEEWEKRRLRVGFFPVQAIFCDIVDIWHMPTGEGMTQKSSPVISMILQQFYTCLVHEFGNQKNNFFFAICMSTDFELHKFVRSLCGRYGWMDLFLNNCCIAMYNEMLSKNCAFLDEDMCNFLFEEKQETGKRETGSYNPR